MDHTAIIGVPVTIGDDGSNMGDINEAVVDGGMVYHNEEIISADDVGVIEGNRLGTINAMNVMLAMKQRLYGQEQDLTSDIINDEEGQDEELEEGADEINDQQDALTPQPFQSEQEAEDDDDDIVIAEAVVVTQYSCKFCNRRFDTIDKVKNHYLQRHAKNRSVTSTRPAPGRPPLPPTVPKSEMQESDSQNSLNQLDQVLNQNDIDMSTEANDETNDMNLALPAPELPLQSPRKLGKKENQTGFPSKTTATGKSKDVGKYRLRVLGKNKNDDLNASKRKRGRKAISGAPVERRFPCDWPGCAYVARHSVHLKDHKRTHTGEKPYKCTWPDCGLSFVQGSALKTHMRTHTGEKPYQCEWPGCSMTFSQKNNVKIHMRTHTGEKPYACDWPGCEWRFAIKGNLDDHKRVHAGEKFFICDWPGCTRSYTQNSHLRRHQLVHMEEKPFACDWPGCSYRSVRTCDVTNHKVTHTGEKKFTCEYPSCGKGFSRSHHLKRHQLIHNNAR